MINTHKAGRARPLAPSIPYLAGRAIERRLKSLSFFFLLLVMLGYSFGDAGAFPERRKVEPREKTEYAPTFQGRHRMQFDGVGRLAFDSSRVRTDRVPTSTRAELSKRGRGSVLCMPLSVERCAPRPRDFPAPGQSFRMTGSVYHFEPEGLEFDEGATLTLPYSYDGYGDESDITVHYYDKRTKRWEYIPKESQDKGTKTVTVKVSHFSDYVAGMSSFKIDEAGTLGGGNGLKQDVDPYFGTLVLKNTEFSVPARGLPLSLSARFSSDALYYSTGKVPGYAPDYSTAGRTFVPNPPSVPSAYNVSAGWVYELPSCSASMFVTAEGKAFDISAGVNEWYSMADGQEKDVKNFKIDRRSSTLVKILIPEIGSTVILTAEQPGSRQIKKTEVYFPDGSYAEFISGRISKMYDASGKNSLTYSYDDNGLASIAHSDGRYIKTLRFNDISWFSRKNGTDNCYLYYILSKNTDVIRLSSEDQFLSRRVFNASGDAAWSKFEKLSTKDIPNGTYLDRNALLSNSLFSVNTKTEYAYSISSDINGNTISVQDPGSGSRTYTFKLSFYPQPLSSAVTLFKKKYYTVYYFNKPKVASVDIRDKSDSTTYKRLEYSYSSPAGTLSDSSPKTMQVAASDSESPKSLDGRPSVSATLHYEVINGFMRTIPSRGEFLQYAYSGDDYQGVSSDWISTFCSDPNAPPNFPVVAQPDRVLSSTKRTFTPGIFCSYYPAFEEFFVEDEQIARYSITHSYDGFGREVAVKDSRVPGSANSSYTYYLYAGTNTDSVFVSVPPAPTGQALNSSFWKGISAATGRDIYTSFSAIAATAQRRTAGVLQTSYTYDILLNLTSREIIDKLSGSATATARKTIYTYDTTTNVLKKITYPNGDSIDLSYGSGYKSSFIVQDARLIAANADGSPKEYLVDIYDYDLRGRTISATSKLTSASGADIVNAAFPIASYAYAYDGCDRVISKSRTAGGATTVLYNRVFDDASLKVTTTDAKGFRTVDSFDDFYRRIGTLSYRPDNEARDASYTGSGQVAVSGGSWAYDLAYPQNVANERTLADAAEDAYYAKTYFYDAAGRLSSIYAGSNSANARIKEISYSFGQDGTKAVEKNYRTASEYTQTDTLTDWAGRTTSITTYPEANGAGAALATRYTYDYTGERLTQTLQNGEVYSYAYSLAGLLETVTYPGARGKQQNVYDLNGRLTKTTDVGGNIIELKYNGADLQIEKKASKSGKSAITIATDYCQYGPCGVTQTNGTDSDPEMRIAYWYGEDGRQKREDRSVYIDGVAATASIGHAYDAAGNLMKLSVIGFSGFSKSFDYSLPYFGGAIGANSRTTSVSASGSLIGRMSTTFAGQKEQLCYGSGATTSFSNYDFLMRPQTIENSGSDFDYSYAYDYSGNVTSWTQAGVPGYYAYDGMNRMKSDNGGGYAFDIIGNVSTAPSSTSYAYITTATNAPTMRLASVKRNGVTTDIVDDGNLGNITAVAGRYSALTFDALNRLVAITDVARVGGTQTDTYAYDPFGRRYKKKEINADDGYTLVMNGSGLSKSKLPESDTKMTVSPGVLAEGAKVGSSTTTYYLYEGNSILAVEQRRSGEWIDRGINVYLGEMNIAQIKEQTAGGKLVYYYLDHLGSRRAVTDTSGNVLSKIAYSTWGVPSVSDSTTAYKGRKDASFTGKELDATGLYYFNARYYDPSMGRFLSEDPARDGMNWYAYCGNSPVSNTDPTGLTKRDDGPSIQDEDVPKSTPEQIKEAEKRMDDASKQQERQTKQAEKTIIVIARARELANSGKTYDQSHCSASASNIYQTPLLSSGNLSYDPITGKYYEQISPDDYEAGDMYVVRYDLPGDHEGVLGHCQINLGNGEYFDSIPDTGPRISGNLTSIYLQDHQALFCSEIYLRPREF